MSAGDPTPRARDVRLPLLLSLSLAVIYALSLSDFVKPASYDATVYMAGARSIASRGAYANGDFVGAPYISGFPPLTSLLLVPATFFSHEILVAKAMLILVMSAACFVLWLYFRRDLPGRWALVIPLLTGLLPESFVLGLMIASEWPYILLSYLFLLWDRRAAAREAAGERTGAAQIALGALILSAAVLCRWVGACLLVAAGLKVLVDAHKARKVGVILSHRLTRTALLGSLVVEAWAARTLLLTRAGLTQKTMLESQGSFHVTRGGLVELAKSWLDMLFSAGRVARFAPAAGLLIAAIGVAFGAVAVRGLWIRLRERDVLREGYFAAYCALIAGFTWPGMRYMVPVAPIALFYFLTGIRGLGRADRLLRVAIAGWALGNLAIIASMLVHGSDGRHGGTLVGLYRSTSTFYQGPWRDVAITADVLSRRLDRGEGFATNADDVKFLAALSHRPATMVPPSAPATTSVPVRLLVWDLAAAGPLPEAWGEAFPVVVERRDRLLVRARRDPGGVKDAALRREAAAAER